MVCWNSGGLREKTGLRVPCINRSPSHSIDNLSEAELEQSDLNRGPRVSSRATF